MEFNVFNIEFDGIDKVGKDTIMHQIFSLAPNRYLPRSRGLLSMIAYSYLNNRGYTYNINKGYLDNTLFVYLTVDKDDWHVRCDLSNEKALNNVKSDTRNEVEMREMKYENHVNAFNYAVNELKKLGVNDKQIIEFNTSTTTPIQIIKKVLERLDELNNFNCNENNYINNYHSAEAMDCNYVNNIAYDNIKFEDTAG